MRDFAFKTAAIAAVFFCAWGLPGHPLAAWAQAKPELCLYTNEKGQAVQVNSRQRIPAAYRAAARCFTPRQSGAYLAAPAEIELKGNIRSSSMSSPVGRIELRWPRKVEELFGRSPERAMADAARTLSRTLKQGAFPVKLQNLEVDWQVVFLDAELPGAQIPAYLINNCHPAWMTPPANMYFIGQRIAGGCGGAVAATQVADAKLVQVLLHEMGHVVEFYLLENQSWFAMDRMRAEGFATWFEQYAVAHSSYLSRADVAREQVQRARTAGGGTAQPFQFSGSAGDYARAAMYFRALEERVGVHGIMRVYRSMFERQSDFLTAIQHELQWNSRRLHSEVQKILDRGH